MNYQNGCSVLEKNVNKITHHPVNYQKIKLRKKRYHKDIYKNNLAS